jgi:hypothetical protein
MLMAVRVIDVRDSDQQNGLCKKEATKRASVWRHYCDVVCGLPSSDDANDTAKCDTMDSEADRRSLLYEKPFWKSFLNVNAVIGLIVVAFLCGFYC